MTEPVESNHLGQHHAHDHEHHHNHGHQHHGHQHHDHQHHDHQHNSHDHSHETITSSDVHTLAVHERILSKNDRLAVQNRDLFQRSGVLTLNILSSPGAGKTSLIGRMAQDFSQNSPAICSEPLKLGVVVGDLATDNDAQRLREAGAPAVQITTGNACHLEADMVAKTLAHFDLDDLDLLIIENVGNLVCPASYDLGEALRVVVLSTTEGEDKPLKYPTMFKTADIALINKVDVAEVLGCNVEQAIANIQHVAPQAKIFQVSARTGAGMMAFYQHLLTSLPLKAKAEISCV